MKKEAVSSLTSIALLLLTGTGIAQAADISGTITSTLTVYDSSKLVGDVTCKVTNGPCVVIQNSFAFADVSATFDLNGFTITGQADPQLACSAGGANGNEVGILVTGQRGVVIHGPGIVESFRGAGILLVSTNFTTITGVTAASNCLSGILLGGGSANNILDGNISIRNGNLTSPCGGI
jgi:hypothetical protein